MPKQATVKTDWINIATSGDTADGRFIKKEWLTDMAEHYDPSFYSAKIWLDHYRYPGAQGSVLELKTEAATDPKLKGEIHLFAIVAPSDYLIAENRSGNYRHGSIEPIENFANRGFTYLGGLAFTDSPASLGTDEAFFSKHDNVKPDNYLPGEKVEVGAFSTDSDDSEIAEVKSMLQKFFNILKPSQPPQEDEPMNDKQFSTLTDILTKQTTAISALVETFSKKPGSEGEGDPAPKDTPAPKDSPNPAAVTAEQFTAQQDEIKKLQESITAFSKKLDELIKTPAGVTETEEGTGAADGALEL